MPAQAMAMTRGQAKRLSRLQCYQITRPSGLADWLLSSLQASVYQKMDKKTRAEQLGQINTQLNNLEKLVSGPYVVGDELTTADGALLPVLGWMKYALPIFFGWDDILKTRPKLAACWQTMQNDDASVKVCLFAS